MKGLFVPVITAVVLVDALTHFPVQYVNQAEPTAVASLNAEPGNIPQSNNVNQNVPINDQDVEPPSTEAVASNPDTSEQPDDVDELDADEEEEDDTKPTPAEFDDANQTAKPTPVAELDFEDDSLNKPAGIDFPTGEPAEKEFDHVEIMTTNNYTTSTVYTTVTSTVTDCVSTVTDCSEIGSVVTKTISLYTTTCPVTTPTPVAPSSEELDDEDSDSPESDEPESEIPDNDSPESELESNLEPDTESDSDIPDAPEPTQGPFLTKTVETTVWYTVTDCAPKETDCPVGHETSSISTRTEIYPVTDIPNFWSPNSTQIQPYATGSPSSYHEPPHTNVTIPTTPPNFTINSGSAQKANGLLMGFGFVVASAIALLQG
ncbi:hypothetical protein EPUL_000891, partial [Erysiphe pulchra]